MIKKVNVSLFIFLLTYGCVAQPVNVTTPSPVVTSTPSSVVSSATPSPVISNSSPVPTPIVSSNPSPVVTSTSTPIPSPTVTPQTIQMKNLSFGINNPFIRITSNESSDYQKESREVADDLNVLNTDSVIIDLNQNLVDQQDSFSWGTYDNIIENFKGKQTEIYFRVNQKFILSRSSTSEITRFTEFIGKAAERYKDYKISWIIGDKVNDKNALLGTQKDFVDFFVLASNNIKIKTPSAQILLGSLVQSEQFGKNNYFTVDNLLSYLNLGLDKSCDGFIFEIYSLDVNNIDASSSSTFRGTNYKIIKNYYDIISDTLNTKGLSNKKLFLMTSTYGGEIVDQNVQSEQEQADDIFRRIIYANASGFDKTFISTFYDMDSTQPASFYKRLGIQIKDNSDQRKKIAYWMYKFITSKLNNTKFMGNIENLPANVKGFIFQSDSKKFYVVWNENKTYDSTITVDVAANSGTLYIAPTDAATLGVSSDFIVSAQDKKVNISFRSYPLSPRIIEVNN